MATGIIIASLVLGGILIAAASIKSVQAQETPQDQELSDEIAQAVNDSLEQQNIMLLF